MRLYSLRPQVEDERATWMRVTWSLHLGHQRPRSRRHCSPPLRGAIETERNQRREGRRRGAANARVATQARLDADRRVEYGGSFDSETAALLRATLDREMKRSSS